MTELALLPLFHGHWKKFHAPCLGRLSKRAYYWLVDWLQGGSIGFENIQDSSTGFENILVGSI